MGNYKFRFSDMIPNAWFYKLRDMSLYPSRRRRTTTTYHHQTKHTYLSSQIQSFPRKSLYFTRDLHSRSRSTTVDYETQQKYETSSYDNSPADLSFSSDNTGPCPSSCSFTANESHTNDIVLDVSGDLPLLELRPILTHPPPRNAKNDQRQRPHVAAAKGAISSSKPRKSSVTSPGVKLRVNSAKIGGRRSLKGRKRAHSPVDGGCCSSLSDSFVVVKTSLDPYRDFRASMMEMIVEKNIRTNKELEELLACYLSLNSEEYHDLIVTVFKQIWLDFVCSSSK